MVETRVGNSFLEREGRRSGRRRRRQRKRMRTKMEKEEEETEAMNLRRSPFCQLSSISILSLV
jgi:hypothetical protein